MLDAREVVERRAADEELGDDVDPLADLAAADRLHAEQPPAALLVDEVQHNLLGLRPVVGTVVPDHPRGPRGQSPALRLSAGDAHRRDVAVEDLHGDGSGHGGKRSARPASTLARQRP